MQSVLLTENTLIIRGSFLFDQPTGIPHETNYSVGLTNGSVVSVPYALELNPDMAWSAEEWLQPYSLGANGGDYRVVFSSEYNLYPNPYRGWLYLSTTRRE